MVSLSASLYVLAAMVSVAEAAPWQHYHRVDLAVSGCQTLIQSQNAGWKAKNFCQTKNQPALGSMAWCLENTPNDGAKQRFLELCESKNNVTLTMSQLDDAYTNASSYLVTNPVKLVEGYNLSIPAPFPIKFTEAQYTGAYTAAVERYINYNYAVWFGIGMLLYWFGIMFIAGLYRLTKFVVPRLFQKLNNPVINKYRKYVTLPALFATQHVNPEIRGRWFCWLVPTRWEALMVAGYLVLVITFNAWGYKYSPDNIYFKTAGKLRAKETANRTGITALWLIPQLVLFAGRNNFMQWVTGWLYSRFVYIHKWIARCAVVLVLVHGVAYTISAGGVSSDKYQSWMAEPYVRWGIVSLVCGGLLVFHSLFFFRYLNYEIFLGSHILFAVFFIIGGWRHADNRGYGQYMYAAVAVWGFDRAVRLGRLCAFGIHRAQVQLVGGDTLRVTTPRPKWWLPQPGCHAFIHFVRPTMFWQSHPFTVVDHATDADGEGTMTLYLKVKGGVTHGLYKYLQKCPGQKAEIPVTVEGPYGTRIPLDRYDNAVFVTGGHGIPGLYYQARDIVSKQGKTRVKFYWTIRHYLAIEWFYHELQQLNNDRVDTVIYVTQPLDLLTPIGTNTSELQMLDEKKSDADPLVDYVALLKLRLDFVEFREGRPSADELVATECREAQGLIAFTTCGSGTLVDATRKAIADNFELAKGRVDYYEQAQIW